MYRALIVNTVFAVLTSVAGQGVAAETSQRCAQLDDKNECALYDVSIIELVAMPMKFNGKRVRVQGFLNLEFEGNALYLHEEDHKHALYRNGLWLNVPRGWPASSATCPSKRYVLLEGTFNAENTGHRGLWSGALEAITRCVVWR